MSSFNHDGNAAAAWGTIYTQGREQSLGSIERARSTAWTPQDEEEYLARVRERAGQMATKLLAEARREAESIKKTAKEEGYALGLESARAELEEFRSGMGEAVAAVLSAIEGQCSHVFEQWRGDIVGVARLCVEKVTALELSENRRAMLESLLAESVAVLEKRRQLVIRVNPEDEGMLADIVSLAKERFPDVDAWRVKADSGISPGGMVVESESSLAEARLESRQAAVEAVLDSLILTGDGMDLTPGPDASIPESVSPAAPESLEPSGRLLPDSAPAASSGGAGHEAAEQAGQLSPESTVAADATASSAMEEPARAFDTDALSPVEELTPEEAAMPPASMHLPGVSLDDPNLSDEEISAALEQMLAGQPHSSM